jgi:hypothetical protein
LNKTNKINKAVNDNFELDVTNENHKQYEDDIMMLEEKLNFYEHRIAELEEINNKLKNENKICNDQLN